MTLLFLGAGDHLHGFALAGVETKPCSTRAELAAAIETLEAAPAGECAAVFLAESTYRLAPDIVDRFEDARAWPVVVRLPEREAQQ